MRYVLEGSVRKVGGRVRIAAKLIDATTGAHLWADRFDGSLEDVFELQDNVAASIAGVIEPALQAAEAARSIRRPTTDLGAYDCYIRALAVFHPMTKEAISRLWGYSSRRSLAIGITGRRLPSRRAAICSSSITAGPKIPGDPPQLRRSRTTGIASRAR